MAIYDKDQERIFKDLVKNPNNGYGYAVEFGMNFLRFKDNESNRYFEIIIKEIKERKKKK